MVQISETSRQDLFDYSHFLQYDHALVDALQVAPSQYADLTSVRLVSHRMRRHTRMMPLLVSLSDRSVYARMQLMDRSRRWQHTYGKPLFAALLSLGDATLSHARYHWLEQAIHWHPSMLKQVWLRLHDPRVFGHLPWIVSEDQLSTLMGPIQRWSGFDPLSGRWREISRPYKPTASHVSWRDEQWELLDDLENINICMAKLVHEHGLAIDENDVVARQIAGFLQSARRIGLGVDEDRRLYAELCIRYGADVHQYNPLRLCLAQAVSKGASYVGGCAALKDDPAFVRLQKERSE